LMKLIATAVLSKQVKNVTKWFAILASLGGLAVVAVLKPLWLAAGGAAFVLSGALFGLHLACGAKYVRHPYPEPRSKSGTVVLAGSYNPPHLGHLGMLKYLSKAHDRVVAVIGANPDKKYDVNPYQRQELVRMMLREMQVTNVDVVVYPGIIFELAHSIGASVMYRGIRTWKEDGKSEKYLEFQNNIYQPIRGYCPIPTAYLQGDPAFLHVSSTLLRRRLANHEGIDDLVPAGVAQAVIRAYAP